MVAALRRTHKDMSVGQEGDLPYCHEWFEDIFSECNITLLGAFDKVPLSLSWGFGISMDQHDL
jgi:hypothetical protein